MSTQDITHESWWPSQAMDWPEEERLLLAQLRPDRMPAHVAIIMDGNGRWARQRGFLDRIRGHEAGIQSVREATTSGAQLGLKVLSLYAFSKENWQRPGPEINALMSLLNRFLVTERGLLQDNNIRLISIGDRDDLPANARKNLEKTIELTADNTGMTLNLALSYGGRDELTRAVKSLATRFADGSIRPDQVNETLISDSLDTQGLPDPDLLVRTSGEMRVSNFLLWQIAYSEIHVTPVLWPDFRRSDLLQSIVEYQRRERRFGKVLDSDLKQD